MKATQISNDVVKLVCQDEDEKRHLMYFFDEPCQEDNGYGEWFLSQEEWDNYLLLFSPKDRPIVRPSGCRQE